MLIENTRLRYTQTKEDKLELEQLRQLDMIAQCGTMQAAAVRLHLSQSALSRSVR